MRLSGENITKLMVGDGSSSIEAQKVMVGTGTSSVEAWTSTIKLTGTKDKDSRDQLLAALESRGIDHTQITEIPFGLDTSEATDLRDLFAGYTSLQVAPEMDTSNVRIISGVFMDCPSLEYIPELDARSVTETTWTFLRASNVRSVIFSGITATVDLHDTRISPTIADDFMRAAGTQSLDRRITLPDTAVGCNPVIAENKGWNIPDIPGTVFNFTSPGDHNINQPSWATHFDYYLVAGGGGGASGGYLSGNGNGAPAGNIKFASGAFSPSTGNTMGDPFIARVGGGGAGGVGNSNSAGSSGDDSWFFPYVSENDQLFGWRAFGGGGGAGTGGDPGRPTPTNSMFSNTFVGASSAGVDVNGRTPGGGGGGGSTGGLIGGGGRNGRRGGSGRVWVRLRGGAS